ncbi:LysR family substrate-binding domain-containing protein [Streptomyces scopuliridis]|uniref:LysR family substrate-binding domain-containing protein n=1 Tax=Streptomyces scopuliridis TaxID=452529 RepID=UPI0036B771EE
MLLEEARDLLVREDRLRALVRRAGEGDVATLRAGVPPDTPAPVLHALLAACAERAPDRVDLREVTTEEQLRLLASGRLDVGLVHQPADTTGLVLGPEVSVELGVVLPRTSPPAGAPEVALGEPAGHDLVLFPRATAPGRYDSTLDSCRQGSFVPDRIHHARTLEFVIGLVAAGGPPARPADRRRTAHPYGPPGRLIRRPGPSRNSRRTCSPATVALPCARQGSPDRSPGTCRTGQDPGPGRSYTAERRLSDG